jgi:hypothetical protein
LLCLCEYEEKIEIGSAQNQRPSGRDSREKIMNKNRGTAPPPHLAGGEFASVLLWWKRRNGLSQEYGSGASRLNNVLSSDACFLGCFFL